jgi:hypothetical protein
VSLYCLSSNRASYNLIEYISEFDLRHFKVATPTAEDFDDRTSLTSWMKLRKNVYSDRQHRVEEICRKFNVSISSLQNTFDDAYTKVVYKDAGKTIFSLKNKSFFPSNIRDKNLTIFK